MRLTDSKRMRNADNEAIHVLGIPSTLLMANAAKAVAVSALDYMGENRSAAVFCGSGNNGGDGVASAVYLLRRGVTVRAFLVGTRDKITPDTAEMERRLIELGGCLEDYDHEDEGIRNFVLSCGVIIDAMVGIGLNTDLRGAALKAAELINESKTPVVAADIASGVESDTGRILGTAVRCVKTVTFSMAKPGHFTEPGSTRCGALEIADIGIPQELLAKDPMAAFVVVKGEVFLPKRKEVSHKSDYGKLLIIGGSVGYTGAPSLCSRAAVRSGAGLVFLGVPQDIYQITAVKNDEAMPFPLAGDTTGRLALPALPVIADRLKSSTACVIGPGLGRSDDLTALVAALVETSAVPTLIDADGLFALSQDMSVLKRAAAPAVLTPHEGEFTRLGGALTGDRIGDALAFARQHGCILVLKGHRTVCAFPDGEAHIINAGNPGMAKGGSGDVLAGVLGAMMCQLPLKEAIIAGAWLHARAGDLCAQELGEYSMTPTDIIGRLSAATAEAAEK